MKDLTAVHCPQDPLSAIWKVLSSLNWNWKCALQVGRELAGEQEVTADRNCSATLKCCSTIPRPFGEVAIWQKSAER